MTFSGAHNKAISSVNIVVMVTDSCCKHGWYKVKLLHFGSRAKLWAALGDLWHPPGESWELRAFPQCHHKKPCTHLALSERYFISSGSQGREQGAPPALLCTAETARGEGESSVSNSGARKEQKTPTPGPGGHSPAHWAHRDVKFPSELQTLSEPGWGNLTEHKLLRAHQTPTPAPGFLCSLFPSIPWWSHLPASYLWLQDGLLACATHLQDELPRVTWPGQV